MKHRNYPSTDATMSHFKHNENFYFCEINKNTGLKVIEKLKVSWLAQDGDIPVKILKNKRINTNSCRANLFTI